MEDRKTRILVIVALLFAIISVSIGYAAMSTTLRINGSATMDTSKWKIRFKNLSDPIIQGDASVLVAPTLSDTIIETYKVKLSKNGDSVTYTFDVTNESSNMDAIIGTYTKQTPTCTGSTSDANIVCPNISYELRYTLNNELVKENDTLNAGETKNLTLRISYNGENLPQSTVDINNLNIIIIYDQN